MSEPMHGERDRRIQAETSLQSSEELFRLLVGSVRDYSIFLIDREGRIATWNLGAKRIKGYEADEIIGKPYSHFFTDQDRKDGKPQRLLKEAEDNGSIHDEGWRLRKDGTTFWVSATITVLHDGDGKVRGFAKITHDDTKRHFADESLRQSEERFRLAISALREHAFYMLNPEGIVESWNAGAERHKGYASQEIIGKHFSVFFTEDDRVSGKPDRELDVAARTGSFEEEGWRVRKDGSRFWASIVITALFDRSQALRGFVKVTRDETIKHQAGIRLQQALDRARAAESRLSGHAELLEKQVEERTRQLTLQTKALHAKNCELEQFAFAASHDLKEPLRISSTYLDLIRLRWAGNLDEKAKGYIDHVIGSNRRMAALVDALLVYATSGSGFEISDVLPLREVVEAALANIAQATAECGALIEIGTLPTVRVNRVQLTRVFQNLLLNSIKYRSADPPRIHITAELLEHDWIVSVADNGIGISREEHENIFKMFHRLHAEGSCPGVGIGLATCKKIVEQHNGRIWTESQVGQGSIFRITLPSFGIPQDRSAAGE